VILAAEGVRKVFSDGKVALHGLDLEIPGGMFGLLGPNGAGKTTLMRILTGLLEPTAGKVLLEGRPLEGVRDWASFQSRLGYLPQEYEPIPHLSGRRYLGYLLGLSRSLSRRERRRRVEELLEIVGLQEAADRPAGGYSGGMARRLGIAQALMHEPEILVVDEPTAGLDPEERVHFRNLIGDLSDEVTVVLSTHIVEDVEVTCPRLALIAEGRTAFVGSPGAMMGKIVGRCWTLEAPAAAVEELRRRFPVTAAVVHGERVELRLLAEEPPPGATPAEPSLEEACLEMLRRASGEMVQLA
jgi:ABC-type multidrug transport system ATPase subunit